VVTFAALLFALLALPGVASAQEADAASRRPVRRSTAQEEETAKPAKKTHKAAPATATKTAAPKAAAAKKSGKSVAAVTPARTAKSAKAASAKAAKKKSVVLTAAERRRLLRLNQAFVSSADLKPMARQLFSTHSPAAYAGVESYARRHAGTDAGALAWLAVGYSRFSDKDYPKAVEALKLAQPRAGDLGDYVAHFLASAYLAQGRSTDAVVTLRDFEAKYPDSLLLREAMHLYGQSLLGAGRAAEAARILQKYRAPVRADFELELGRTYEAMDEYALAAQAYKTVYYTLPQSAEAASAKSAFDHLVAGGYANSATFAERRTRANLLVQAKRHGEAAHEYRALLALAPADQQTAITVALGVALHRSGDDREARTLLDSIPDSADASTGPRLYALAEMARSADDKPQLQSILDRLRQYAPASESLDQALLLAANYYLLHQDYDHAIAHYRELQQRFPNSPRAAYAHWKGAWLALRQGRADEARHAFEEEVQLYPAAPEVPAALYWRARLAEDEHDFTRARAWYEKLTSRFRSYYYAELARTRLATLPHGAPAPDPLLDGIPAAVVPASYSVAEAPPDSVRLQKSRLLENAGMTDAAVKELQAAVDDGAWAALQMARIYQDAGQYHRALHALKRAMPGYFSLEIEQLPRPAWEYLFPRPFWAELKRNAAANELDPFLVASLIRQESEFNPGAVSRADALGLMQLLPVTGRKVAREMKLRSFSPPGLLSPATNLQLGTRYFREMVDHFGGHVEYALAAYNAGPDRVQGWLAQGNFRDVPEFVESIPFTETREYVQAIVRNAAIYRKLYGTP
jgi:soluble lytic murein transglycosylase